MFKPFDSITQVDFQVFTNKEDTSQVKSFLDFNLFSYEMQCHKIVHDEVVMWSKTGKLMST